MTITKLIKELQKIKEEVGPRARVCINADAYRNFHDEWDYNSITKVEMKGKVHSVAADKWLKVVVLE